MKRKFSQVEYSLGIDGDVDDGGVLERLETQMGIMRGIIVVLVQMLEAKGILSPEESDLLDRVKYNYYMLSSLEADDEA